MEAFDISGFWESLQANQKYPAEVQSILKLVAFSQPT